MERGLLANGSIDRGMPQLEPRTATPEQHYTTGDVIYDASGYLYEIAPDGYAYLIPPSSYEPVELSKIRENTLPKIIQVEKDSMYDQVLQGESERNEEISDQITQMETTSQADVEIAKDPELQLSNKRSSIPSSNSAEEPAPTITFENTDSDDEIDYPAVSAIENSPLLDENCETLIKNESHTFPSG